MKKITFLLAVLFCYATTNAQGIEFTDKEWDEVLKEAQATNKPIFMDAYTTWCGPCKKMSKYVFTKPEVGTFYNQNFINVKMDMEKGIGVTLAKKYHIRAYPTLLYLNPEGEVLHRVAGYRDADQFIKEGQTALGGSNNGFGSMLIEFKQGNRNPQFLRAFAYASKSAATTEYRDAVDAYLKTQKDWSTPQNLTFIFDFVETSSSDLFSYLIENRPTFEKALGSGKVFNKVQSIIETRLDQIMNAKGNVESELVEAEALFVKVYQEEALGKFAAFRMTYYRSKGDRNGFAEAAIDYVNHMKDITADELNSIARTFAEVIEDKPMLEKAVEWTKRAIEMENLYDYRYTLAALYFKMDKRWKAKCTARKAIRMAKKVGDDPAPIEELLAEIKNSKKNK